MIDFNLANKNIKSRLLAAFIIVIASLFIPMIFFFVINYTIEDRYSRAFQGIILEYKITEASDNLVSLYSSILQNVNNEESLAKYNNQAAAIDEIFTQLDKSIVFNKSIVIYQRLKNTIGLIKENCRRGIDETVKGNFSHSSEILEQINTSKDNIREDTANLILVELDHAQEMQNNLRMASMVSLVLGMLLFILASLGCLVFAFVSADKISNPLIKLSKLAQDISRGNLELNVQKDFLERHDEVGSLSNSFNSMVTNLREKIVEVKKSYQEVTESQKEVEAKMIELERLNKLMVGRELKMIELKKQLEQFQEK